MTIYTPTARFDGAKGLDNDQLHRMAPSIFAVSAHESRSERFKPIPTIAVLEGLRKEGFVPVGARQSRSRDESKREFTKHLIRLRRIEDDPKFKVGDTVCEILLKNANDGTSAYDLMAGLFRIACMNSLVTQIDTVDSVKVRHSGNVQEKVIEGTYQVLEQAKLALVAPQDWSQIRMKPEEQLALAEAAHALRFDDPAATPIKPHQFLTERRHADSYNDLWTRFNVIQENMIKGGLSAMGRDANNRLRRHTTRTIKGIDQDVKLNRALWVLTQRMAEIKRAA